MAILGNYLMLSYAYWGHIKSNYHFSDFNVQSFAIMNCFNRQFTQFDYNSPFFQSYGYRSYGRLIKRALKYNDALSKVFHISLKVADKSDCYIESFNLSIAFRNPFYQCEDKAPIRQNCQLIAFNFKKNFTLDENFNQAVGLFDALATRALDLKLFAILESNEFLNIEYYHAGVNNIALVPSLGVVVLQKKNF